MGVDSFGGRGGKSCGGGGSLPAGTGMRGRVPSEEETEEERCCPTTLWGTGGVEVLVKPPPPSLGGRGGWVVSLGGRGGCDRTGVSLSFGGKGG